MSFISLHGNIPPEFGLVKELHYLGMDETQIHGPIPGNMENTQQIKYLSIKSSQPTTQLLWYTKTFPSGCRFYKYSNFDVEKFYQILVVLKSIFLMKDAPHVTPWCIQYSASIFVLIFLLYLIY